MSIQKTLNVTCPRCGTEHEGTFYDSINTSFGPDVAEQIISGRLFQVCCPRCQHITVLRYNVLYNDQKNGAMIWLVHSGTPNYEEAVRDIRTNAQAPYSVSRIVGSIEQLREKVLCLEQGRDDRVVELCKRHVLRKPELENIRRVQYVRSSGREQLVLTNTGDEKTVMDFPGSDYEVLKNRFDRTAYARTAENFAVVDEVWADQVYDSLWSVPALAAPEKPKKAGRARGILAIILAVLLLASAAANVVQLMIGLQNDEELERLSDYEMWYEQIVDDADKNHDSTASDHFYASKNVIVLKQDDPGYKLKITAFWEQGGEVYLSYSSSSASVSFDEKEWYDTTTVTVNPHSVGATVATFTNSVDDSSFKVLIIVTE